MNRMTLELGHSGLAQKPVQLAAILKVASLGWRDEGEEARGGNEAPEPLGRFEGTPPKVELLDDGRKIRLLSPIRFLHDLWAPWPVPAGTVADGASIPRLFWTAIGGPFEGRYRNASIIHDHHCVTRDRPWRDVHRMFFEAMRAGGVGNAKAKIMYYAVYRFGPRWELGDEAILAAPGLERSPSNQQVEEFAFDAEAIYLHHLDLDEIDALADAREGAEVAGLEGAEGPERSDAAARARNLVVAGGSCTAADMEAVSAHAALLPAFLLDRFERTGIRIVACRDSVTDFERSLRGVVPRGWEKTGKSWDDVPGCYLPGSKRVVIATIAGAQGREVPAKGSRRHGSVDLVVHESFHGFDYVGGHAVLAARAYLAARLSDLARLGPYERQDGQAGLEESFAESGARFVSDRTAMETDWPNLFTYWAGGIVGTAMLEGVDLGSMQPGDAPIGTAEILPGGAIEMELRAEGPGGAIGHAWLNIAPDDPDHGEKLAWLRGGRKAGGPVEEAAEESFLVRP